jgi:starch phosphorylase
VRMAWLAIVGSFSVNGVAALHSRLLKEGLFRDFVDLWPGKFNNKTNGVTPRRWVAHANPGMSALITRQIGEDWVADLSQLERLKPLADLKNEAFHAEWRATRRANKERLAALVKAECGVDFNPDALFDVQVKRIHEYKRQLLNVLHVIHLYNRIKHGRLDGWADRCVLIGGKAAPGYVMAKRIIKLINDIADIVNNDPAIGDQLKVVFIPNYNVSVAEIIIPACELSEQISTAGTEASGTSNMKFALNGALTIGTLDGANVEIHDEVGQDNIFIFGLTAGEVAEHHARGYNPWDHYHADHELRQSLEMIASGYFSPDAPELHKPIVDRLTNDGDPYLLLADYAAYISCQERVAELYINRDEWTRKAVLNVAHMGKFSSDRTIREYAEEIWNVKPVTIKLPNAG